MRRPSRSRSTSRRPHNAAVFAALGDETRLALIEALSAGESLSITRLTAGRRVTRQAITKHLHVLSAAGLVRATRQGREQLWELDGEPLREARRQLEVISGEWDSALARLRAQVEDR
ncbi:MAG TPA: metalloregulator ArsR/SmtB family transcription factor [Candidatus Sulfopaludibacter sp.]|jgi:DNA-binding transcriptional ArsR family regulator|nr:metalloregulator ArsR/SmtB family transcription factor [Candidatus Sulfopaludibacter sp.]